MKTEIEKVVKEKYPDNMKYGVEYQMDELRPEDLREAFKDGVEWLRKSLFHKTKDEVPQPIGDYANEVYPQIPCLVKEQLSTGYGYGVRYWNVKCQVWDDEECDDAVCVKHKNNISRPGTTMTFEHQNNLKKKLTQKSNE